MAKSFIELVVGSLDEKRAYRQYMKRVSALPKDYRYAFKRMQNYLYYSDLTGCEALFTDLVELLEASSAEGKPILDVVGADVAGFCDELVRVYAPNLPTPREKLNRDILKHFNREGR